MSRFSQYIVDAQLKRGLTEHAAAREIGVTQQNFSAWKSGTIPRTGKMALLAKWLGVPPDELLRLASTPDHPGSIGIVTDRKVGKFRFESVPTARYQITVNTKVMEPSLRVGALAWLDPAVPVFAGNEVMAHTANGAFLGRLVMPGILENASGRIEVGGATLHAVVLSSRIRNYDVVIS